MKKYVRSSVPSYMDKETLIYNLERMADEEMEFNEDELYDSIRSSIAYGMVYNGESFSKSVDGVKNYFTTVVDNIVKEMKMVYGLDDNFTAE